MKILYVINKSNVGGLQTTTRNKIKAMKNGGIQADVIFLEHGDGEYLFKNISFSYVKNNNQFTEKVILEQYDIILFVNSLTLLNHVPSNFNGKLIYELRGWSPGVEKELSKNTNLDRIDGVFCIANHIIELVKPYFNKHIPILVEGNTIDPEFKYITPIKRQDNNNVNIQPKKGHLVIAFVGRVENQKNWIEFVNICRLVAKKNKIEVWIISNPNTSKMLKDMINELSKSHIIVKTKHVPFEKMPIIYSKIADSGGCLLSTSIREGLGNSILEPMACMCPVVSSDKPGKNEIIIHGKNGFLYPLGNIKSASKRIDIVINNTKVRNQLVHSGLKTINENYGQKAYVERFLKLLSKI